MFDKFIMLLMPIGLFFVCIILLICLPLILMLVGILQWAMPGLLVLGGLVGCWFFGKWLVDRRDHEHV